VYDLPLGKGRSYLHDNNAINYVVGGWQVSPIIRYSRGTLLWVRSDTCQVVSRFAQGCLVGLVPGVNPFLQDPNSFDPGKGCPSDVPNCNSVLNPAAFESAGAFQPKGACPTCTGVYGYTGTGPRTLNLRGPNYKNVDFALTKNTKLSEKVNFQLRVEFYNLFNFHIFVDDGNFNQSGNFAFNNKISASKLHSTVNGQDYSGFGVWGGNVSAPRRIQIGARLEF
jgi:hypothetical protein